MIERILTPEKFCQAIDEMGDHFLPKDKEEGHLNLSHNAERIKQGLANRQLLLWRFPTWAFVSNGHFNSLLICETSFNVKFGQNSISEFLWLSKDGRGGIKLFREATTFAQKNNISMMVFSSVNRNPSFQKLNNFYIKNGFSIDSQTYIKTL